MKHVLIVENATESLKINESNKTGKFLLHGIFTEFDVENRNKRFYRADNFVPCMESLLNKKKKLGVLYGEFDHPDVFDITGKNISHAIEDMSHNVSENRIDGSIALLSTHWGKEARAIINDGYPLFVSSRAAGMTDTNGVVALKELFTYDVVVDPGFASARVSINESMGFQNNDDVPYRIYEMNDTQVNHLFNDNRNDQKTGVDLAYMKEMLQTELAKIEHEMVNKMTTVSSEEVIKMQERYEMVNEELKNVNEYMDFIKKKVNYLIKENSKLVEANKLLSNEINENILYSNHLSSSLNNLNSTAKTITERLDVSEKMLEYVAKEADNNINETKATILFVEDLAKNTKAIYEDLMVQGTFIEYIAEENKVTQLFAENNAKELEVTQLFVENNAKELEVTQQFAEYTANETKKNDVYHNYISEKVDGIIGYTSKLVESIKSSTPVNESIEDSIHNLEEVENFLGLDEELAIINNVQEEFEFTDDNTEEGDNTEEDDTTEGDTTEGDTTEFDTTEDNTEEGDTDEQIEDIETNEVEIEGDNIDVTINTDETSIENEIETQVDSSLETQLLSSLVKILGSDDTGIVLEITPENKVIIQKSGTEETVELSEGEYELINTEENVTETIENVLAEIKKQKVLANQEPHFFSFLSEEQIADFKALDKESKDAIMLAMNESEYFNTADVLEIIGEALNNKSMSYEEKLVTNVPTSIKEAWNALAKEQKMSIITESKYFNLVTSADIKNFWMTRSFAKALNSPDAILIKESVSEIKNNEEGFSEEYINAFINKMK